MARRLTPTLTYERNILRTEITVYGLLKDKSIPIPKIYVSHCSKRDITCDYFIMELIGGETWNRCANKIPQESRPKLLRELGRYNARIHSVEGGWFGYTKRDQKFWFDTWCDAFCSMLQDILNDGKARKCRLPYDKINNALCANKSYSDDIKTPCLVSFDIWAGNVFLYKATHSHITGLIDFERNFYGDPYVDFTSAAMLFDNIENETDFCAGYCEVTGVPLTFTDRDRIRMNLCKLYMSVILYVETYRYNRLRAAYMQGKCKNRMKPLLDILS